MANVVSSRTILDGPAIATVVYTGVLDTSNLAGSTVVDVTTLEYTDQLAKIRGTGLIVEEINYDISDTLLVQLAFEASPTNDVFANLSGWGEQLCFQELGSGRHCMEAGKTGKILITTTGYTGGINTFTITLKLRKQTQ